MRAQREDPPFLLTCHPDTLAFYQYWRRKCGDRHMPRRSDMDPTEIPPRLLPGISLVEVVPDERRYVYRLVGTADVEVRGTDPTGKSVREGFFGPTVENALGCYDQVVASHAPVHDPVPFTATNGRYASEETLFLPLSDDGVSVNKIIVFFTYRSVFDPDTTLSLGA